MNFLRGTYTWQRANASEIINSARSGTTYYNVTDMGGIKKPEMYSVNSEQEVIMSE